MRTRTISTLRRDLQKRLSGYQDKRPYWVGRIGDWTGVVYPDATHPEFIYVRDFHGGLHRVFNNVVEPAFDVYVKVAKSLQDSSVEEVIGSIAFSGSSAIPLGVPPHEKTHEFPNFDALWVHGEQFLPWVAIPSGMTLQIYPALNLTDTGWTWATVVPVDFTSPVNYVPATTGMSVMALVSVDNTGHFTVVVGAQKHHTLIGVSDIPSPTVGTQPLWVVKLVGGVTSIEGYTGSHYTYIYDARWGFNKLFADVMLASVYDADYDGIVDAAEIALFAGDVAVQVSLGNISNPPTQAELTALIGSPITAGKGRTYQLNDADGYNREYLCVSDGFYWWVLPLVKTAYTEPTAASASNAASHLTIPTYDGSGQAVHPGVFDAGDGKKWNGYRYWMVMTPYPGSDQSYEKPDVIASNDGTVWVVPSGLTNPINTPTPPAINSDADIMLAADGLTMWAIYRESNDPTSTYDKIMGRSSTNGITWSAEYTIIPTTGWATLLSPAVIPDGGGYSMWAVDATGTNTLKRRTCATMTGAWGAPSTCTLNNMPGGKDVWHLDVVKRGKVYHAFIAMCDSGTSGNNTVLYFAVSLDGITWTVSSSPLLSPSGGWDNNSIYRSSGVPTAGGYDLFYSAMTTAGNTWHIGRTPVTLS